LLEVIRGFVRMGYFFGYLIGVAFGGLAWWGFIALLLAAFVVRNWRDAALAGMVIMVPSVVPALTGLAYLEGRGMDAEWIKHSAYILPMTTGILYGAVVFGLSKIKHVVLSKLEDKT
jgi:hypothetical protein